MSKPVRWGFLSTANITHKIASAIQKTTTNEIVCIGSRFLDKAQAWATQYSIPRAYSSYQEVLDDPEVDAVYIPLPTTMHCEWTIKAAEKKKHIICEKPLAVSAVELKKMIEACTRNGVQLMDAVHFVHHKRTKSMMEKVNDVSILGKLKSFHSGFTIDLKKSENIRFNKKLEPMGCLGDLGWYNVRAIILAFNNELPHKVYASAVIDDEVPIRVQATLWFSENKTATFECAFDAKLKDWFEISGSETSLWCWDFCVPYKSSTTGPDALQASYEIRTMGIEPKIFIEEDLQELQMILEMERIIKSGKLYDRWFKEILLNQEIIDAIYQSAITDTVVIIKKI